MVLISSRIVVWGILLGVLRGIVSGGLGFLRVTRVVRCSSLHVWAESLNVPGLVTLPAQSGIGRINSVVTLIVVGEGATSRIHNIRGSHTAVRMLKVVTLVVLLQACGEDADLWFVVSRFLL